MLPLDSHVVRLVASFVSTHETLFALLDALPRSWLDASLASLQCLGRTWPHALLWPTLVLSRDMTADDESRVRAASRVVPDVVMGSMWDLSRVRRCLDPRSCLTVDGFPDSHQVDGSLQAWYAALASSSLPIYDVTWSPHSPSVTSSSCVALLPQLPLLTALTIGLPQPLLTALTIGLPQPLLTALTIGLPQPLLTALTIGLPQPLLTALTIGLPQPLLTALTIGLPQPLLTALTIGLPQPLLTALTIGLPQPLPPTDVHTILTLAATRRLRRLELYNVVGYMTADHVDCLTMWLQLASPHTLALTAASGELDTPVCSALANTFMLSALDLSGGDLRYAATLATVALPRQLVTLCLDDSGVTPTQARNLVHALVDHHHVDVVSLSENPLRDDGAIAIAETLPRLATLRVLRLNLCRIGSTGAAWLASALPHATRLEILELRENSKGEVGAVAFAQTLPRCPTLQHLNVSHNGICVAGATALLGAVATSHSLRRVDLGTRAAARLAVNVLTTALYDCVTLMDVDVTGFGMSHADIRNVVDTIAALHPKPLVVAMTTHDPGNVLRSWIDDRGVGAHVILHER
ncbi:Aste57867_6011 [Aphanomyces stellatus]|uniref:Aste57867_6011 protein n=1 Tax=Aphanomyces stellatus TaxID=120398 RepID=A0A485KFC7_9STRA|nr:hypothetical protein As57867_005997 [Aphanomyces stellatus]VFT83025.1 Aste57867_6011 [Aphanomyces stellatus]